MEPWTQVYNPLQNISLSAVTAAVPLLLLFYLMTIKQTAGHKAVGVCCLGTLLLGISIWEMPACLAFSAVGMGMGFGLFPIAWIIVAAVWINNMTMESNEFEKIRYSLVALTEDRRLQAILICFAFSAFLEGAAGFGVPVAISAAMLVGLGFNPFYAAGLCLVANSAPAAFGAGGIPIIVSADVAQIDKDILSGIVGEHLAALSFFLPLWICVIMCGFRRSLEVWPALLVSGLAFSLMMYLTARFNGPTLPDILAGLGAMLCLVILFRVWKPKKIWRFPGEELKKTPSSDTASFTIGQIIRAWSPYLILTVLVFICGMDSYKTLTAEMELKINWPALHNLTVKTIPIVTLSTPHSAVFKINPLTAAGTAIFTSGIIASFIMPNYGPVKALACFARTVRQLRFSILTICLVLGLAYIMNYSGMSSTLGLAFTQTGILFPFFSPAIGWVGVFLTGSDTSANALFSSLQRTTGEALGENPELMVAANSLGGVSGKMISPQSISVAAAATQQLGQEGKLFTFALLHSLVMLLIICISIFAQARAG